MALSVKNMLGGGGQQKFPYVWEKYRIIPIFKEDPIKRNGSAEYYFTNEVQSGSTTYYYSANYTFDKTTGEYTLVSPTQGTRTYSTSSRSGLTNGYYVTWLSPTSNVMARPDANGCGFFNNANGVGVYGSSTWFYVADDEEYEYMEDVVSSDINAYPSDGKQDGYYYKICSKPPYVWKKYNTNNLDRRFIEFVTSKDANEYPNDGYHTDGFYYINARNLGVNNSGKISIPSYSDGSFDLPAFCGADYSFEASRTYNTSDTNPASSMGLMVRDGLCLSLYGGYMTVIQIGEDDNISSVAKYGLSGTSSSEQQIGFRVNDHYVVILGTSRHNLVYIDDEGIPTVKSWVANSANAQVYGFYYKVIHMHDGVYVVSASRSWGCDVFNIDIENETITTSGLISQDDCFDGFSFVKLNDNKVVCCGRISSGTTNYAIVKSVTSDGLVTESSYMLGTATKASNTNTYGLINCGECTTDGYTHFVYNDCSGNKRLYNFWMEGETVVGCAFNPNATSQYLSYPASPTTGDGLDNYGRGNVCIDNNKIYTFEGYRITIGDTDITVTADKLLVDDGGYSSFDHCKYRFNDLQVDTGTCYANGTYWLAYLLFAPYVGLIYKSTHDVSINSSKSCKSIACYVKNDKLIVIFKNLEYYYYYYTVKIDLTLKTSNATRLLCGNCIDGYSDVYA